MKIEKLLYLSKRDEQEIDLLMTQIIEVMDNMFMEKDIV